MDTDAVLGAAIIITVAWAAFIAVAIEYYKSLNPDWKKKQ